ncbi:MAG: histidinol-phosphate transaminase [Bacillota bacterium]|jgi:histidinol-phosphate aminotransferase
MSNINKLFRNTVANFPEVSIPPVKEEILANLGLEKAACLDSNENPMGTAPKAIAAIQDELNKLNRYPESGSTLLRTALAEHYGLDADNVIISNGGDNIITTLMNSFINEGDEIVVCNPYFFVYGVESGLLGGKIVAVEPNTDFSCNFEAMLDAVTEKTKMIMLTNPNNPTATLIGKKALADFIAGVPENVLVVLDEAYAEFVGSHDYGDGLDLVKADKNILIIRTFSKLYGLAGLRVGYALAPKKLIANMRKAIETFPVNRLGQAAAAAALTDSDFVEKTVEHADKSRAYLRTEFKKLGLDMVEGCANFCFVNLHTDSKPVVEALAGKGIFVKNGYGWGYPEYARISFGTDEENQWLINELKIILNK